MLRTVVLVLALVAAASAFERVYRDTTNVRHFNLSGLV
jgi:hypothetical protein